MKRILPLCLVLAVVCAPAGGTILIKKSLAELAREAKAIVLARVDGNRAAWNPDRTLIWTTTTLTILETWKGPLSGRQGVMEPGGELPGIGQMVEGMARYAAGDTVVVFLTTDVLGQWRTLGCCQGAFRVVEGPNGVRRPAISLEQRHVVDGFFPRLSAQEVEVPDLAAFRAAITTLAAGKAEGR